MVIESIRALVLCLLKAPADEVGHSGHCHLDLPAPRSGLCARAGMTERACIAGFTVTLWLEPAHSSGFGVKH